MGGWSNTKDCGTGSAGSGTETSHPFFTNGQTYSSSGSAYSGYTYFNGCALGGGCGSSGTDGIGFGDLQGHLRANYGDRGFGGTAWPGGFRWDQDSIDSGTNLPYLYFWKPYTATTVAPTAVPTPAPTRAPTNVPTQIPSPSPTSVPTPVPSPTPSETPTTRPPSPSPSHTPTEHPTAVPSPSPTDVPTPVPSPTPTQPPTTPTPTPAPTAHPTYSPTERTEQCNCAGCYNHYQTNGHIPSSKEDCADTCYRNEALDANGDSVTCAFSLYDEITTKCYYYNAAQVSSISYTASGAAEHARYSCYHK